MAVLFLNLLNFSYPENWRTVIVLPSFNSLTIKMITTYTGLLVGTLTYMDMLVGTLVDIRVC